MTNPIGWATRTWNPMTGCTAVSEACLNCYAHAMARRFDDKWGYTKDGHGNFWPRFHAGRLAVPLHWRKPQRVFVCSMSDLFHEAFSNEQIHEVILRTIQAHQHTYLILTKRPKRMRSFFIWLRDEYEFVPGNLWLGVTAENQQRADERIPILLDTPAAVRFVSVEPMLGAVELPMPYVVIHEGTVLPPGVAGALAKAACRATATPMLDWVIVGGENGPGARPMQPEWTLDVYRQCKAAGVAFWFKSMGTANLPERWDWPGAPSTELLAEMQATRDLPAVTP